jgi:hypothetical protein
MEGITVREDGENPQPGKMLGIHSPGGRRDSTVWENGGNLKSERIHSRVGLKESIKSTVRKDEGYPLLGKIEKFYSHGGWMNSSEGGWKESIAWRM